MERRWETGGEQEHVNIRQVACDEVSVIERGSGGGLGDPGAWKPPDGELRRTPDRRGRLVISLCADVRRSND